MKRMLWTLALTFLAVFGGGAWYSRHQAAVARAERWSLSLEEDAADARLDRLVRLDGQQVTLGQLRNFIAAETGLEVTIDEEEILRVQGEDLGSVKRPKSPDGIRLFLPIGQVPLRSALDQTLHTSYLDYRFLGSSLELTTQDAAGSELRAVTYPLPQPMLAETNEHEWADLIRASVEPDRWAGSGRGQIEAVPGALVVVQTPAIHRRVRILLERLSALELEPDSLQARRLLPPRAAPPHDRLLAALDQPASLSCSEKPLEEVLQQLAKQHGISIALDSDQLQAWGVHPSSPVAIDISGVSLRSLLHHILNEVRLTFLIRGDTLVIVTLMEAESELAVVAYPVQDLVWGEGQVDSSSLQNLITGHVAPQSWPSNGPQLIPELASGWLVVPQTEQIHDQLAAFLSQLRRGIAAMDGPVVDCPGQASPAAQRVQAALRQPMALDYNRVPLREVFRRLAEELGINIVIDQRALQEAGDRLDLPITWHVPAIPLGSQLFWMLRDPDLMWIVRDEALVITTTAETQGKLLTRIYDVRNLVDPDLGMQGGTAYLETLIKELVMPDSWSRYRGSASLTGFQGLMVVSQTEAGHDSLQQFLAALEKHCRYRPASSQVEPRLVRLDPSPSAERIERTLSESISVNYCGVPLEELLRDLARQLELPVAFDRAAVVVESYDFQQLVSISAHERPLVEILEELFGPMQFDFQIREDMLFFTFKARREDRVLQKRLYRVGDLLPKHNAAELSKLAERLASQNATYWHDLQGGPGAILPVETDWLVVSADWRRHQEVARQIAAERKVRALPTPSNSDP